MIESRGEGGVSPVVGVILTVAIVVILSAVIGAFVFDLGTNTASSAGSSSVGVTFSTNGIGDTVVSVIDGGDVDSIRIESASVSQTVQTGDTVIVPAGEDVTVITSTNGERTVAASHPYDMSGAADGPIYVDDSGSDSAGDGSETSPYATIGKGVAEAAPGQTVVVKGGTYAPDNVRLDVSLTVKTNSGAELNGSTASAGCVGTGQTCAFNVTGAAQPTIAGFVIHDYDYPIEASRTSGSWRVQDVEAYNAEQALRAVESSGDWQVVNFHGHDTGHDVLMAMDSSGAWTVRNSTLESGGSGLAVQQSSGDWTVNNTVFGDVDHGIYAKNQTGQWTATYNTFKSTIQYNGIRASGSSTTGDATYNYWKDGDEPVSGWDQDYNGPLTYDPWCTTADCSSTSG